MFGSPCQVRDDPNLLDDSGEVTKSKWRSWRFDSRLWIFSYLKENKEPTYHKVVNKLHPAPRGSLSRVGANGLKFIASCPTLYTVLILTPLAMNVLSNYGEGFRIN